jgi:hypothetical protein
VTSLRIHPHAQHSHPVIARTLAAIVVLFSLTLCIALLAPAAPALSVERSVVRPDAVRDAVSAVQSNNDREVLVAVVRSSAQNGGDPDSLAQIAARNLGSANRAPEIFALNQGRRQADGAALTDETVRPGWILLLPEDADGPDVQAALLEEPAQGLDDDGEQANPGQTETAGPDPSATPDTVPSTDDGFSKRFRWPILLALTGGIGVAVITTAIVLRKRLRVNLIRLRTAVGSLRKWQITRRQRRLLLRARQSLISTWARDTTAVDTAREVLGNPGAGPDPVAVSVTADRAVRTGSAAVPANQLQPGAAHRIPVSVTGEKNARSHHPVVRIGGDATEQIFMDLSQCRGVLSIAGDTTLAVDLAHSLLNQLNQTNPDLLRVSLGSSALSHTSSVVGLGDLQRFGLAEPAGTTPPGLIHAVTPATGLIGVLLIQPGRPQAEVDDVAARCASPDSGWLMIHPGQVSGAHWRWIIHKDGQLTIPMLDRTVTANGTTGALPLPAGSNTPPASLDEPVPTGHRTY